jgi:hypothetical protein
MPVIGDNTKGTCDICHLDLCKGLHHRAVGVCCLKDVDRFTKAVGEELGMRRGVYPKWVESGRMKKGVADQKLKDFEELYSFLKKLGAGL